MASSYLKPASVLADLVLDETPSFALSSRCEYCLLFDVPSYLSLEDVAREEVRVAGLRFNGQLRSASRVRWSSWAKIRSMKRLAETGVASEAHDISIKVPSGTRMRMFEFSKDNKYIAFLVDGKTSTELWVATVETGDARRVISHLNGVMCRAFQWRKGVLLAMVVPERNRCTAPEASRIPAGPVIKEHLGGKAAPARTYHDLLVSEHDEVVFEHYGASLVYACHVATGQIVPLLEDAALYSSIEISPDCQHLLVHKTVKPYSRSLPASRFSKEIFVLALSRSIDSFTQKDPPIIAVHPFALVPCQEDLSTSFDARTRGPRSVEFAWNEPHTLVYVQALDEGEPENKPDASGHRDALYFVRGPSYDDRAAHVKIFSGPLRVESVYWTDRSSVLVEESWYKTRQENFFVIDQSRDDAGPPRLLYTRSSDDAYASWGSPRVEFDSETGHWRCKRRPSDGAILFIGEGASPNGSRPFLDYVHLHNGTRERAWRSAPVPSPTAAEDPSMEPQGFPVNDSDRQATFQRPLDMVWANTAPLHLPVDGVLITAESPTLPPNLVLVSGPRGGGVGKGGSAVPVTTFPHPQPSLLGVKKELIRYTRLDGVELSANLYLPANYDGKSRLPLLCWAYPLEFKSKEHASQIKTSPHRFIRTSWSSPTLWLSRQFAVLDNFSVPIVGVGEAEPNDTFIEQLVSSAEAAVQECVKRGVADPERVAVGGHSYGAFMSVHLLAHTRLFKAAIGRSGAYNRLLTPFGYQGEERTFWDAPNQIYLRNSPFTHADKIEAPLLLIHGNDDPNPGTHVFQTERLFAAMQGLGKKVRMVILPCERHSYDAIESVLHVVAEQDSFLMKHVANKPEDREEEERAKRAKI